MLHDPRAVSGTTELWLPASTTEELQSVCSIDFLPADLISFQQKDHLEAFLKRKALILCLNKMLWENWSDSTGGLLCFWSQWNWIALLTFVLLMQFDEITLSTACSVCSQFCYSNLPDRRKKMYFLNTAQFSWVFPACTGGWEQVLLGLDWTQPSCARFEWEVIARPFILRQMLRVWRGCLTHWHNHMGWGLEMQLNSQRKLTEQFCTSLSNKNTICFLGTCST